MPLPNLITVRFGILPTGHYVFRYITGNNHCDTTNPDGTTSPTDGVNSLHHYFELIESVIGERMNLNEWRIIRSQIDARILDRNENTFEVSTGHTLR